MKDTPQTIEEKYRAMLLELSPAERLAMACRMFSTAKAFARAGIGQGDTSAGKPSSLRRLVFMHFYRNDFSQPELERILNSLAEPDE